MQKYFKRDDIDEQTAHLNLTVSVADKRDLLNIARRTIGSNNISALLRYWVAKYKNKDHAR